MKLTLAFVPALLALLTVPAWADAPPPADAAALQADEANLEIRPGRNLHTWPVGADGSKGYTRAAALEHRSTHPAPFTNDDDFWLHQDLCRGGLAWAQAQSSISALAAGQSSILTRTQFTTVLILKDNTTLPIPAEFTAVREGGEVIDGKDTLRINWRGRPNYVEGETYLLSLVRGSQASTDWLAEGPTMQMQDGLVSIGNGVNAYWYKLPTGVSPEVLRAEVERVMAIAPCDALSEAPPAAR